MKRIIISLILISFSLCFSVAASEQLPRYSVHEHVFDSWAVTKAPSLTETGVASSLCNICGTVEGREISTSLELTLWQNAYKLCGEEKVMDCTPIISNDRTMLPIRYVAEGLGATVEWDEATSTAAIDNGEKSIKITVGSKNAIVNGKKTELDAPAFIENERVYMPVRFVAEELGTTVSFNPDTSLITITDIAAPVAKILNIPYIYQKIDYPNGCESVSTVMTLQYFGVDIDTDTFMDKYLDCGPTPVVGGIGPDPDLVYCGNPHLSSGWGCHSPVIVKALNKFLNKSKFSIAHSSDKKLDELCKTYIDKDIPVIIWASVGMKDVSAEYYYSKWKTESGETIRYNTRLHCLVFVGYDKDNYYFNDPLVLGNEVNYTAYPKKDTTVAYNLLYRQSIAIIPK